MKFQKIHLFIILLLALIFCGCLGTFMREGMSSQRTATGDDGDDGNNGGVVDNNYDDNYSANTYTGDAGNSATVATGPGGQAVVATTDNTVNGIHHTNIPSGQQDLYILKSQIVPPVCPVCPSPTVCPRQTPCQPCPPCSRCPEPAFDCKKVPNYASSNDNYLPRPVMSDFSQFGM